MVRNRTDAAFAHRAGSPRKQSFPLDDDGDRRHDISGDRQIIPAVTDWDVIAFDTFNATPMHPEYPSQAAIFAGVSAGVFDGVLGPGTGSRLVETDNADPKVTRQFDNFAAIVEETRVVRICGGIHFRSALDVSDVMGRQVAAYLVANSIKPVR
jgi:hypothetical protein